MVQHCLHLLPAKETVSLSIVFQQLCTHCLLVASAMNTESPTHHSPSVYCWIFPLPLHVDCLASSCCLAALRCLCGRQEETDERADNGSHSHDDLTGVRRQTRVGGVSGDGDGGVVFHSSQLHSVLQSVWRLFSLRPVQLQLAGGNQLTRLVAVHTLAQHLQYMYVWIHIYMHFYTCHAH